MICNSCRRTILSRFQQSGTRRLATISTTSSRVPSVNNSTTTTRVSSISTSSSSQLEGAGVKEVKKTKLQSSIPGGTELKGLAYLKTTPKILAKEDDEYPDWLWTLLDEGKQSDGKSAVDLAALTKKQRAKHDRKQAEQNRGLSKSTPIHEQSMDLTQPGDDAVISLERRQEITKSSRDARRKEIRESNFLKGM